MAASAQRKTSSGKTKRTGKTAAKGSAKRSPARKPDKRTIAKKKQFFSGEMSVILSAALGLFLFLSNFGVMGAVGAFFSRIEMGLFGLVGYAFPVLLILSVVVYVKNREGFLAKGKLFCALFSILILCAIFHLLFGTEEELSPMLYYTQAAEGVLSGGLIGGMTAGALRGLVGNVGTYLILIVLLILCMVVVTERSFVNAAKSGAEKTVRAAREGHERVREASEERRIRREARREEERLLREERIARGVDLGSTKLEDWDPQKEVRRGMMTDEAMMYAGYGRELIGEINPSSAEASGTKTAGGVFEEGSFVRDGREKPAFDPRYDTQIMPNPDVFRGRIEGAEEYDYEDDSVPFEEIKKEKYKSYRFDGAESSGAFGIREAQRCGYAAQEDAGAEQEFSEHPQMDAFLSPEEAVEKSCGSLAEVWQSGREEPEEEGAFFEASGYGLEPSASETRSYGETLPSSAEEDARGGKVHVSGENREQSGMTLTAGGKEIAATTDEARALLKKKLSGEIDRIDTGDEQKRANAESSGSAGEKASATTKEENEKMASEIRKKTVVKRPYVFPPLRLLKSGPKGGNVNQKELKETAIRLQQVLRTFGVGVTVTNVSKGPTVTRYELTPDVGVKVSRITSLSDDIKLALAAEEIRIEAPIPGKAAVGIEVPNQERTMVSFREVIDNEEFRNAKSKLSFGIGKDLSGKVVIGNIAKMPHLLIAGATGAGKSVGINTLIMSLIYKASPEDVRMIMIDPKVVELSVYNGIPHLLIPVVTDPKKAASALNWAVAEMMDRYKKFAETGARDLSGYNEKLSEIRAAHPEIPEEEFPKKLPQIVIIVDELADLKQVASAEVEDAIVRLTQLARAAGLHLIIATQRPSVNVITGLIKANVPSRIAFKTASQVDSRTILDMAGAEKLLGSGDMLYAPSGIPKPIRLQGAFVSDEEVREVVSFITKHTEADYSEEVDSAISQQSAEMASAASGAEKPADDGRDEYFAEAGRLIIEKDKASIGMLQRMFKIGFNRAARVMDQLSEAGVVGPEEGTKPRKILMDQNAFEAFLRGE